jgi:HlyD family secretion protein
MRRTILILVALLILIIAGYFVTDPESGKAVLVEFGLIQDSAEAYQLSGLLEAEVTVLSSENGGRLIDLQVAEGDEVKSDDPLLHLDPSLLELQLAAAKARLQAAEGNLNLLLENPRGVDLAVAEAALAKAALVREAAAQALEDTRETLPAGGPEERIELAELDLEKAELGLDAAQTSKEHLEEGPPESSLEGARAALRAAQAAVEDIERRIEAQEVRSPLQGTVLDIYLKAQEFALPSQPIISIANLETLSLTVYLPESDFSKAEIGQSVSIAVDTLPDQLFEGTITAISNQAEFTPRNVQTPRERVILVFAVKISIPNPNRVLKPGIPVEVNLGVEL